MLHVMGRGRREIYTALIDISVGGRIILCRGVHWIFLPWVGTIDGIL
jgi:hypothetical protein